MRSAEIALSYDRALRVLVLAPGPGPAVATGTDGEPLSGLAGCGPPWADLRSLGDLRGALFSHTGSLQLVITHPVFLHLVPEDVVSNSQMPCPELDGQTPAFPSQF